MKFVIGVDTGGTFTDCVAIGEDGSVAWDKAHTTPQDHTAGILNAIENTSARLGISRSQLLGATVASGHRFHRRVERASRPRRRQDGSPHHPRS